MIQGGYRMKKKIIVFMTAVMLLGMTVTDPVNVKAC